MNYKNHTFNEDSYETLKTEKKLARKILKGLSKPFRNDFSLMSYRTDDGTSRGKLLYPTNPDLILIHKPTLQFVCFIDSESTENFPDGREKWPKGYKYPPSWNYGYSFLKRKNEARCIYVKHNEGLTDCYFATIHEIARWIKDGKVTERTGPNGGRTDEYYDVDFDFLENIGHVGFSALLRYINTNLKKRI